MIRAKFHFMFCWFLRANTLLRESMNVWNSSISLTQSNIRCYKTKIHACTMLLLRNTVRDFRLPPRCKWDLCSSAILRSVDWYLVTDESLRIFWPKPHIARLSSVFVIPLFSLFPFFLVFSLVLFLSFWFFLYFPHFCTWRWLHIPAPLSVTFSPARPRKLDLLPLFSLLHANSNPAG